MVFFIFEYFNEMYRQKQKPCEIELETALKIIYSKHVEIFCVIESVDFKRKKMESIAQHIGLKYREFRQVFVKQKRLRDIWDFFDPRENDLLKPKIRIFRALNKFFFSLMTTGQIFSTVLQKYFLIKIRSCIKSTLFKFWKELIFYRYQLIFLRHFLNNGPLS